MCFTETQSYINTILLLFGAYYTRKKLKLSLLLLFLSTKDLIQGLSYRYIDNKKILNILGKLSWIHISLQPFMVNLFVSHFDTNKNHQTYWNLIYILSILYAILNILTLKEFNIDNDPLCDLNKCYDFCTRETTLKIGKYHIKYKFARDNDKFMFWMIYLLVMLLPAFFTNARPIILLWALFIIIIRIITCMFKLHIGEYAAIWCFLSIIFFLPIAIFEKKIIKILT